MAERDLNDDVAAERRFAIPEAGLQHKRIAWREEGALHAPVRSDVTAKPVFTERLMGGKP